MGVYRFAEEVIYFVVIESNKEETGSFEIDKLSLRDKDEGGYKW